MKHLINTPSELLKVFTRHANTGYIEHELDDDLLTLYFDRARIDADDDGATLYAGHCDLYTPYPFTFEALKGAYKAMQDLNLDRVNALMREPSEKVKPIKKIDIIADLTKEVQTLPAEDLCYLFEAEPEDVKPLRTALAALLKAARKMPVLPELDPESLPMSILNLTRQRFMESFRALHGKDPANKPLKALIAEAQLNAPVDLCYDMETLLASALAYRRTGESILEREMGEMPDRELEDLAERFAGSVLDQLGEDVTYHQVMLTLRYLAAERAA